MPRSEDVSVDFLLSCSTNALQDLELARLARVANLQKQIRAAEGELLELESTAMLARWLLAHREELRELGRTGSLQMSLYSEPVAAKRAKRLNL